MFTSIHVQVVIYFLHCHQCCCLYQFRFELLKHSYLCRYAQTHPFSGNQTQNDVGQFSRVGRDTDRPYMGRDVLSVQRDLRIESYSIP
jgi:hypothetical protein